MNMNKRGALVIIGIVAAVAVGATAVIAFIAPQQDQAGTLTGLEQEQRGDVVPGEQPTAEGPDAVGSLSPETGTAEDTTTNGTATGGGNASTTGNATSSTGTANQSGTTNTTESGSIATDNPETESDNPFSDFT